MFLLGVFVINAFDVVCNALEVDAYPDATVSDPQCFTLPLWDFSTMRFPGVLQRIAFAFFVSVFILLYVPQLDIPAPRPTYNGPSLLEKAIYWFKRDLLQWLAVFLIFTIYMSLMFGWHVPDCGQGHLGPECNAAQYADIQFWGKAHMYQNATCVPDCPIFDPEGLMGDFTAVLTCFLGVHIGRMLLDTQNFKERAQYGTVVGLLWLGLGILLHETWIPINKNLWSPSFVLFMAGAATLLLILLTLIIDELEFRRPFIPLIALGMNSIAIYAGSETVPNLASMFFYKKTEHSAWWLLQRVIYSWADEPVAGFLFSFMCASLWTLVAHILYQDYF
jgi:heparan-alpha-glucosaminide N-acetyltransferase